MSNGIKSKVYEYLQANDFLNSLYRLASEHKDQSLTLIYELNAPHDQEFGTDASASCFRNETTSSDDPSIYRACVRGRPTAQEK